MGFNGGLLDLRRSLLGEQPNIGLQGFPQLQSNEIIRPTEYSLVESASVFTELEVKRAVRLWVPGQRRVIRAVPHRMPDSGANVITRGLYIPSVNGIVDLLAPGIWHINTPIVTAEGTSVTALYSDAAFAVAALNEAEGEDPNSWVALYQPRVLAAPAGPITIDTTAGGLVLAAAAVGRRFMYLRNLGAVDAWIAFGATPAVNKGILVKAGEEKSWDALDGITEQECRGITAAGSTTFSVQTGT